MRRFAFDFCAAFGALFFALFVYVNGINGGILDVDISIWSMAIPAAIFAWLRQ